MEYQDGPRSLPGHAPAGSAQRPRKPNFQTSGYSTAGPAILFLRAGTLDRPDCVPPDIHIYTSTCLSWLNPAFGGRSVPGFYDLKATWPAASLARYRTARASAALDASSGSGSRT